MSAELRYLGLGLSSNLNAADEPNPWRLLDEHPGLFDFVEYSAPLSFEQARAEASLFEELLERRAELPVLFHPVHLNLWGPALESEAALAALAEHARAVGSAWVGNDLGWWHSGGQAFPGYLYVAPPFDADGVRDCAAHARHVQGALGELPLLIENPAVMAKRGTMHVLDFMRAVHEESGCGLLIDLGHLWSHQLAAGLPLTDDRFGLFPWHEVVELHLAGGVVTRHGARQLYVDDHTQPVREELFKLLEAILPRCSRLRALTYEGDGHPREVALRNLSRLREAMPPPLRTVAAPPPEERAGGAEAERAVQSQAAGSPASCEARRPQTVREGQGSATSTLAAERAWRLFDEVHGVLQPTEDPTGTGAELDFRAAVVAELLDAHWPMTRLLLAGSPERLKTFLGSSELRNVFAEPKGSKGLNAAFATWARRACLSLETAPFANAVALETWAQGLHRHSRLAAPGVQLSSGVHLGTFPSDLTELHFAVKALRRHLTARAWANAWLELSGLETLAQLARRAPTRAWNLVVRKSPQRTELLPVSPGLFQLLRAVEAGLTEREWSSWSGSETQQAFRLGLVRADLEAHIPRQP